MNEMNADISEYILDCCGNDSMRVSSPIIPFIPRIVFPMVDVSGREEFEDAHEDTQYDGSLDLVGCIREVHTTLHLFINNRYELAEERMKVMADRSMYHASGLNVITFMKALMTCEKANLEDALVVCKNAQWVIESKRQKWNLTDTFTTRARIVSDEELHAELCYAECLLVRAALTFFQDESLASFVRGALRIRTCHQTYKTCYRLLETSSVWEGRDKELKDQFEAGVRLGVGSFNLLISCLPSKVLRLLEVVGFSGDKDVAFAELHACHEMHTTLRGQMCAFSLLAWHLVVCFYFGVGRPDLDFCERALAPLSLMYPNGALVLYLRARLHCLRGEMLEGIRLYVTSIRSQTVYIQFHHVCYWELIFAHSFLGEYHIAAAYARKLCKESRWSRTVYTYLLAALFCADCTVEEEKKRETVRVILGKVDEYRSRIAGKSIPIEKFCSRKAERGLRTGSLHFSHLEFMYFLTAFETVGDCDELKMRMEKELDAEWRRCKHHCDVNDECLHRFLKGVLLRQRRDLRGALNCLTHVLEREGLLTDTSYIAPNVHYEMSLIHMEMEEWQLAEEQLNAAVKYRSYSMENKLHFRVHYAREKLAEERERAGTLRQLREVT